MNSLEHYSFLKSRQKLGLGAFFYLPRLAWIDPFKALTPSLLLIVLQAVVIISRRGMLLSTRFV